MNMTRSAAGARSSQERWLARRCSTSSVGELVAGSKTVAGNVLVARHQPDPAAPASVARLYQVDGFQQRDIVPGERFVPVVYDPFDGIRDAADGGGELSHLLRVAEDLRP